MTRRGTWLTIAFVVGISMGMTRFVAAQSPTTRLKPPLTTTPPTSPKPRTTFIEIKLLASTDGGALHSQQWLKAIEPLDVSLQIQKPSLDDKPEVREREVGTIRYVTAVGLLDRSGKIAFPGRTFSLSDGPKLKEWIDDLRTYGAQGSPEGQPLWGLSKEQFARLYDSLGKTADADLMDLPLREAVSKLPLPEQYPLRWSQAATDALKNQKARATVRQEVKGFSAATALAIALNDCGLGFRPNRTPAGGLELLIEPLGQRNDQWPVGWPLQQQRLTAAPKFFTMTTIELDQVELSDVFLAVSELAETPVLVDYAELDAKGIDPAKLKVSFKRGRTSWSVALKQMVIPQKLTRQIWQDEAGRAFVWITTNRPGGRSAQAAE
ncbi:MAG: hypothetical protein H7062_11075 [Candidatus Saccharimonas sp.]|nr:hypothetical protein [Planctomycetaceae bacterium]